MVKLRLRYQVEAELNFNGSQGLLLFLLDKERVPAILQLQVNSVTVVRGEGVEVKLSLAHEVITYYGVLEMNSKEIIQSFFNNNN